MKISVLTTPKSITSLLTTAGYSCNSQGTNTSILIQNVDPSINIEIETDKEDFTANTGSIIYAGSERTILYNPGSTYLRSIGSVNNDVRILLTVR